MGVVDFHNHVIPGVDDGASDDVETIAALAAFCEQGVVDIVATPHVEGSLTLAPDRLEARLQQIDVGWARLESIARERFPDLRVRRGAEVTLDAPNLDLIDERLRLDGGRYALVEYPYMTVPPHSGQVIEWLAAAGVTAVIAHPERYHGATPDLARPRAWRKAGAMLQINAGSLTGRYGPAPRENAFALLEHGMADFMCSDFHARGRPSTARALQLLRELGATELAEILTSVNPRLLLAGDRPIPAPPLRVRRGVWSRVRQWLG
jgi:protein-tyrosine phosphatase